MLAGLLLWYLRSRRAKQQARHKQAVPAPYGADATLTVRPGRRAGSAKSGGSRLDGSGGKGGGGGSAAVPVAEPLPSPQYITVHAADYVVPHVDVPGGLRGDGGSARVTPAAPAALGPPAGSGQHHRHALPHLALGQHVVEVSGSPSFGQMLRQRSPRKSSTSEQDEAFT